MRRAVVAGLLATTTGVFGSACASVTDGSPSAEGAAGAEQADPDADADPDAAEPVPEVSALAPVCDAIKATVEGFGLAPDMEYDTRQAEGYEGGPGDYCIVTSDTLVDDLRGYSLEVTAKVDAAGAASMAERREIYEPLPGEPDPHETVEIDGADHAYLGPSFDGVVMVYAFQANLEVYVNYHDSDLGAEVMLDQAKSVAAATIAANTFAPPH